MGIRRRLSMSSIIVCLAGGVSIFAAGGAHANYVLSYPNADFSAAPFTVSLGGVATFTFTDISATSGDPLEVDAVSTGGNGQVNSFIGPISFSLGSVIGDTGYGFEPFPTPAGILFSAADTSIGIEFFEPDGVHYGFVRMLGPEITQYGYNSTPGGFIPTGVPEPATWIMLIAGVGALGMVSGLRRSKSLRTVQV
jgi:PEP-CTERM motif